MNKNKVAQELIKMAKELTALDTAQRHQKAIAIKTLKMSDFGAKTMGGMTKEEAREFLKSLGYRDSIIKRIEKTASRKMIIEKEIYDYDDLKENKELRKKVIAEMYNINVNYEDWAEPILDAEVEKLEKLPFEDVKISYSGFSSQGDGASFTGKVDSVDVIRFLKISIGNKYKKIANRYAVEFYIERSGRYYHENSTSISWSFDDFTYAEEDFGEKLANDYEKQLSIVEEKLKNWMVKRNREIYKALEESYDYLTSEEAIMETIKINDYEFDEDGKLI